MAKITKTIKIEWTHEEWLKSKGINFSKWIRNKLDHEINLGYDSNRNKIKAVILAAGKDNNLFPLTKDKPKTLLEIKGKTILKQQIEMLRSLGIDDIAVIRGYKKDHIDYENILYFDNNEYEHTGSLASLFLARKFMDKDTIVLYGDILFDILTLKQLVEFKGSTTLVVDRGWKKHYIDSKEGHSLLPELTVLSENNEKVKTIGVGLLETNLTSEFIGLAKLTKSACQILSEVYKRVYCNNNKQVFNGANSIKKASFVDFIQELINRGEDISALEICRNWIEVDTFEDYRKAWKLIDTLQFNSN